MNPISPKNYVVKLLNPAYAALHAVNPKIRVAGGITAPRAGPERDVADRVPPRDEVRRREARRVRAQSVPGEPEARDADVGRLQDVLLDHDGLAGEAPERGAEGVARQAHVADGVRLPDEPAGQDARRLLGEAGAVHRRVGAARLQGRERRHADPVHGPRRPGPGRLAERLLHDERQEEAVVRRVAVRACPVREEGEERDALGPDPPGQGRPHVPAPDVQEGLARARQDGEDERFGLLHADGGAREGHARAPVLAATPRLQPGDRPQAADPAPL